MGFLPFKLLGLLVFVEIGLRDCSTSEEFGWLLFADVRTHGAKSRRGSNER